MEKVEFLILRNLLHNEEYLRKVVPFLKSEYFEDEKQKIVYQEIASFVEEYNELTTKEVLCIEIEKRKDITDSMFKDITSLIDELDNSPADLQWLLDTTEKWCRDRAIYLALIESISLADGKDDTKGRDAIPSILSDALAVSFDNHVGHDYLIDYEERYESYHRKEDKIPFDLEFFDKVTKGGLPNKTLNIALAGTGVGKSLFMCHFASSVLLQGKNVLYITMEMAEEKIAERIDANLMDVTMEELHDLPKPMFTNKVDQITFSGERAETSGQSVKYVTERAVFELKEGKVHLIEIAPGIDLEKQILAFMDFEPLIDKISIMDPRIFSSTSMMPAE